MKQRFFSFWNSKQTGKVEYIFLFVWIVLVCIIRHFHEPWFDETQAWQIARFASVKELLTEVEHYEGHPPLWHLILMPFAKAGLPYKITIFCINTIFNVAAFYLLLFRSPFPRWIRCYLPFTFYIFYQHGVQTRPYSMTMLALFLAATAYPKRNQKPWFYVLSLIFLCFTTVYGVVIAFGICLVWCGEMFAEYRATKEYKRLFKDCRILWLVLLAIIAFGIFLLTRPAADIYNSSTELTWNDRLERLYFLPLLVFDCSFGLILTEAQKLELTPAVFLGSIIGTLIWCILVPLLHKNKKLFICIIPYVVMTLFCSFVYFGVHHLEVFQMFFIFVLWILFQNKIEMPAIYGKIMQKIESRTTLILLKGIAVVAVSVPIICTVWSSVLEIKYRYGPQEQIEFIKTNHLENAKILSYWSFDLEESKDNDELSINDVVFDETLPYDMKDAKIARHLPYLVGDPATVYAEFDDDADFFCNFNVGESQHHWMIWRDQTPEQVQETFQKWRENGLPDFIIRSLPIQEIYTPEQLDGVTYYWIDDVHYGRIWKLTYLEGIDHVYIRSDLLDEYPQFHIKTYAEEAKK